MDLLTKHNNVTQYIVCLEDSDLLNYAKFSDTVISSYSNKIHNHLVSATDLIRMMVERYDISLTVIGKFSRILIFI